jgi:hypothetical protein
MSQELSSRRIASMKVHELLLPPPLHKAQGLIAEERRARSHGTRRCFDFRTRQSDSR